jgi:hypothetical protein
MSARDEIRAAMMQVPVSWLHMPALAAAALPGSKGEQPAPKVFPVLAAAALGVASGAGIQLAHQYLHDRKSFPPATAEVGTVACTLTLQEIEDNATQIYEESQKAKDGGPLKAIADSASNGAKAFPVVAAVYLAGVAAGAAAARH